MTFREKILGWDIVGRREHGSHRSAVVIVIGLIARIVNVFSFGSPINVWYRLHWWNVINAPLRSS